MFSMRLEHNLNRSSLKRRTVLLGMLQGAAVVTVAARLRYLQVTESEQLAGLAEKNRINIRLTLPERGLIFDRNGVLLAGNERNYKVQLIREDAGDAEAVLENLRRIIPLSDDDLVDFRKAVYDVRPDLPVIVAEEVDWRHVAAVAANAPNLPGVQAIVGYRRIYPLGADFAHLVGYVGSVSKQELNDPRDQDPLLNLSDFKIGKDGVEKGLERSLRGSAGNQRVEVNAYGRVMRELDHVGANHGSTFQITVDSGLQNYAAARVDNAMSSAVLMDVTNGEILALTSTPSFNPNRLSEFFAELRKSEFSPFHNRPVQGTYPPGSTFKMVVALAALDAGLILPDEEFECSGSIEAGDRTFHCWNSYGHGKVDLIKSLSESCDVYYYQLALRVGINRIMAVARQLGIGIQPSLPIPGIEAGIAPTPSWKFTTKNEVWHIGDTLNASIGQGFVLASGLQLAIMTARIATGLSVEPYLVLASDDHRRTRRKFEPLELSEQALSLIREGMFEAVNNEIGTAYESRSVDPQFDIVGKTGTSQVRTISKQERTSGIIDNEDLPLKQRDHALFCCYAPSKDPKYAVAVIIEHGGSGSKIAAPIARDLIMRAHYGQVPPLWAYPAEQQDQIRQLQQQLQLKDAAPNPVETFERQRA